MDADTVYSKLQKYVTYTKIQVICTPNNLYLCKTCSSWTNVKRVIRHLASHMYIYVWKIVSNIHVWSLWFQNRIPGIHNKRSWITITRFCMYWNKLTWTQKISLHVPQKINVCGLYSCTSSIKSWSVHVRKNTLNIIVCDLYILDHDMWSGLVLYPSL